MKQEEGLVGNLVGGMIRRSVKGCFRNVYWSPPAEPLKAPVVFCANHHGWHDGYLMFIAVSELQIPTLDWIAEFDSFPLFSKAGGMAYPPGDSARRSKTVRETIKRMNAESVSLLLFADGVLRRPGEPWEVGSAVELIARQVAGVKVVPVGIRYDMSIHQRPEVFLSFGSALDPGQFPDRGSLRAAAKAKIEELLLSIGSKLSEPSHWKTLHKGRPDVNERWDMRKAAGRHSKINVP